MEIGARIAHFRTAKGYTVNRLAYRSGVSQSYLREIEAGTKNPTIEILSLLCEALEISLRDFFDDQGESSLLSDPLVTRIYRLTPQQRASLCVFLDSMEQGPD